MADAHYDVPVLPIFLNLREAQHLLLCVQICLGLDTEILTNEEARWSADMRDLGRADQVRTAARDRRPILMSLQTALSEHMMTLERTHHCQPPERALATGELWRCECGQLWQLSVAQGRWIMVNQHDEMVFRNLGFDV